MALSQDNLNFPLCQHLNTSSFRSFSSLRSLKLIILIFFIDTQVTSTIEAIRSRRLPDYFPLNLGRGRDSP